MHMDKGGVVRGVRLTLALALSLTLTLTQALALAWWKAGKWVASISSRRYTSPVHRKASC